MNIRDKNNFDLLRFLASSLVLFSHSFSLLNNINSEPLYYLSNGLLTLGRVSVIVFFIVSGFLISASWESRKNFMSFITARILRIFPGLAVMLGLTIFVGLFISSAGVDSYFCSAASYFIRNLLLYKGQLELVGVFQNNPFGASVNGSLWTLRLEFTCYLMMALIGVFGFFQRAVAWLIWVGGVALLSAIDILPTNFIHELLPLLVWFTSGMLAYLYRDLVLSKLWWLILAIIVVSLIFGIAPTYISPFIALMLVKLIYLNSPFVNFAKYGDFSYGIYIYAFPIQQLVVYLIAKLASPMVESWIIFLVSFPFTLLCAIASWHLVEKRFIGIKKKILKSN